MFRPEKLLEKRQITPARLTARQPLEAIREIAAGTTAYASFEYYMQRNQAIEMLAERALGEEALKSPADGDGSVREKTRAKVPTGVLAGIDFGSEPIGRRP